MTRKDYVALAQAMHDSKPADGAPAPVQNVWHRSVDSVAVACAVDNPRFDRARFIRACVEGVK